MTLSEALPYVTLAAAVFSGLSMIAGVYGVFGRPLLRSRKLKTPYKAGFTDAQWSDSRDKISIPRGSTVPVAIRVEAHTSFQFTDWVFGFSGVPGLRPRFVDLIDTQARTIRGEKSEVVKIHNHHDDLQVHYQSFISAGNTKSFGFNVEERAAGVYQVRVECVTEGGSATTKNTITVEVI